MSTIDPKRSVDEGEELTPAAVDDQRDAGLETDWDDRRRVRQVFWLAEVPPGPDRAATRGDAGGRGARITSAVRNR